MTVSGKRKSSSVYARRSTEDLETEKAKVETEKAKVETEKSKVETKGKMPKDSSRRKSSSTEQKKKDEEKPLVEGSVGGEASVTEDEKPEEGVTDELSPSESEVLKDYVGSEENIVEEKSAVSFDVLVDVKADVTKVRNCLKM